SRDFDGFLHLNPSDRPPRQQQILAVIRDWVVRYGYAPSTREIGDAVGLRSSSSVSRHLASLQDKGFLRRGPARSRPIDTGVFLRQESPRESSDGPVTVPVVGDITAGNPIPAGE